VKSLIEKQPTKAVCYQAGAETDVPTSPHFSPEKKERSCMKRGITLMIRLHCLGENQPLNVCQWYLFRVLIILSDRFDWPIFKKVECSVLADVQSDGTKKKCKPVTIVVNA
jgi:hypothetical protein